MSTYSHLKVADLRRLCDDREIGTQGLKKAELVAALCASDNDDYRVEGGDGGGERASDDDDGVAESDGDAASVASFASAAVPPINDDDVDDNGENASEAVKLLRLKLQLAEKQKEAAEARSRAAERNWAIEKERLELQAQCNVSTPAMVRGRADIHHILPKMTTEEDILGFFHTYERAMQLNNVDPDDWSKFLPAQLNSKANKVLSGLSLQESLKYDVCKSAILSYYQLSAQTYLKNFRTLRRSGGENFRMFRNKLKEFLTYFIDAKQITDLDTLADNMLMEQMLECLPTEIRRFVIARQPLDSEQCAEFADLYAEVNRNADKSPMQNTNSAAMNQPVSNPYPQSKGNGGPKPSNGGPGTRAAGYKRPALCWSCGSGEHKFGACPLRVNQNAGTIMCKRCHCLHPANVQCHFQQFNGIYGAALESSINVGQEANPSPNPYVIPVTVNGRQGYALRDTGNLALTFVDTSVVPDSAYTGETVTCYGIFAGQQIPLAFVNLASAALSCRDPVCVKVAVCKLPDGLLCNVANSLFHDYPQFADMLCSRSRGYCNTLSGEAQNRCPPSIQAINTRAARKRAEIHDPTTVNSFAELGDGRREMTSDTVSDGNAATSELTRTDLNEHADKTVTANHDMTDETTQMTLPTTEIIERTDGRVDMPQDDMTPCDRDTMTASGKSVNADSCTVTETLGPTGGGHDDDLLMESAESGDDDMSTDTDTDHQGSLTDTANAARGQQTRRVTRSHAQRSEPRSKPPDGAAGTSDGDITTRRARTVDQEPVLPPGERSETADLQCELDRLAQIDMTDIDRCETEAATADDCDTETAWRFRECQKADKTLQILWERAQNGSREFKIVKGLLYKVATSAGAAADSELLLVLPQSYQSEAIRLAHDTPFAAHLGINKTKQRVSSYFHFPKMKNKIVNYVKTCHTCQLAAPRRKNERQPLNPVKIIDNHPFAEIQIDVLGPRLPTTSRKNKFLLTILCSATKWLHAVPLTNLRATTIADKLIDFFSFAGIPKVIRSDNMGAFRSEIFSALRERLGIEARFSTPYHFQSHGGIERGNRTLGDILRKFLESYPKTWDQLLPYILFALREVKNETTNYSPAELVFGRRIRGLLAIARDCWTNGDPMEKKLKMPSHIYGEAEQKH